jgi:hypothetical protein
MNKDLCDLFCEEYTRHMDQLYKRHNASLHSYKAELEKLERERKNLDTSGNRGFC